MKDPLIWWAFQCIESRNLSPGYSFCEGTEPTKRKPLPVAWQASPSLHTWDWDSCQHHHYVKHGWIIIMPWWHRTVFSLRLDAELRPDLRFNDGVIVNELAPAVKRLHIWGCSPLPVCTQRLDKTKIYFCPVTFLLRTHTDYHRNQWSLACYVQLFMKIKIKVKNKG